MTRRQEDGLISVTVSNGKYTIRQVAPGIWEALRYGEEWPAYRDSGPDNLHVALAYEVAALRAALSVIAEVDDDGFISDGHERASEWAARALEGRA